MLRAMLAGFVSRRLRVALTASAVALGVALMAGAYVLTDTINASFASIFATTNSGIAAVVSPRSVLGGDNGPQLSPITGQVLARVRRVPGVAEAAGAIFGTATLTGPSGRSLTTFGPGLVASALPAPFNATVMVKGHRPEAPGQADLDQMSFERDGLHLGDVIRAAGAGTARAYRLVGTYRLRTSGSFGGTAVAILTLPEAQAVVGEPGRYDEVDVAASTGVSPQALSERLAAALPSDLTVRTGRQQAASESANAANQLGFLRTFLLVFAYVALFVGAFIILNTFSITVAQRSRELGLVRAMGASRAQVLASMVGESLLVGLVGSATGLGLGLLAAPALDQLFKSLGADLPDNGTVLQARTVVVSLLAGVGITLLAGLAPSLRATRVPPVAALREGAPLEPTRWARCSLPACLAALAGGAALVGWGLAGRGGAGAVGGGALALLIGVALLSPRFVPPLAYALGTTVAWRGVTGKMARENARRQPGRTAVTASALMVGLALVTFVSIVASSTQATVNQVLDDDLAGNMVVEPSSSGGGPGLPAALAPALGRVPGVATVAAVTFSEAKVAGLRGTQTVTGIDGAALARLYRVKWVVGTASVMAHLGGGAAIVTRSFASAHHLVAGQRLSLLTPSGRHLVAVVRGVVSDQAGLLDDITLSRGVVEGQFSQPTDAVDFVGYARGATASSVKLAVDRLLASRFPQAQAWTAAEFKRHQADQVGSLLALIYVLLALAVVVSLFGLVNTLVLSIYERSRELGVLRAVGASRRQVRQLVRYEPVVTSLIGAATGLAVGALFGVVMVLSVGGSTAVLSVPLPTLGAMAVVAAAAGVAAAALPARRASRLDILAAVASE